MWQVLTNHSALFCKKEVYYALKFLYEIAVRKANFLIYLLLDFLF